MKRIVLLIVLLLGMIIQVFAQDERVKEYINRYAKTSEIENIKIDFSSDQIHQNDIVFFGFIHGSATPQLVDFELVKFFAEKGRRYYAPEVDISLAYFLNLYLQTQDEALLNFIAHFYQKRVSQDASLQFQEKWRKIAAFNQQLPKEKQLIILGTDSPASRRTDKRLALTHLAHLAPDKPTGHPMVDSLKHFRNFNVKDLKIWSGKPVWEKVMATKQSTYDFVYPLNSRYHFAKRFFQAYQEDRAVIVAAFGKNQSQACRVLDHSGPKEREAYIFENFKRDIFPLLQKGEKVYANYGFAHVQQGTVNGYQYIAGRLKDVQPKFKVASIIGLLAKSNALDGAKLRKTGNTIEERGYKFQEAALGSYKTKKSYDGDGLFERIEGIKLLVQSAKNKPILFLPLQEKDSPFDQTTHFVSFQRGGKRWRIEDEKHTLDYVQYVIFMQKSEANIPFNSTIKAKH